MNKQSHSGSRLGQFLLLLICCGLGYLLWEETNRHTYNVAETIHNQKAGAVQEPIDSGDEARFPPLSSFDEITTRPLFFENREPFVYLEPEEEDKSPKKTVKKPAIKKQQEQFMLNAVIITPDQQIAIIQSGRGRGKNLQTITMGEAIEGWTLEDVEHESVKLTKDGETKYLELEVKGSERKITPPPRNGKQTSKTNINERISDSTKKKIEEAAAAIRR
jgi:hypothetical protein